MLLAIPSESQAGKLSLRSGHFGHCAYFTLVTIEKGEVTNIESVKNVDHDEVGCGGVIEFALGLGIDAILCAGMGYPPYTRFTNGGVEVYLDQTCPTVGDAIQLFLDGKAQKMQLDQACRH